jgi:hypothetical protein
MTQATWPKAIPPSQWGAPPPPPPAQKRFGFGKFLLLFFGILVVAVTISVASTAGTDTSSASSGSRNSSHTVTYIVEGTTKQASITYRNAYGDTSQQSDIDVPLTLVDGGRGIQMSGMERGDFLYISAQNSEKYGTVSCAIEVDGVRVKQNVSRGGYTIATCSGRL